MRDIDIRKALRSQVEHVHRGTNTLILDELVLCDGSVRVDLAVVNAVLHGYEIKSEHDTLARLPAQSCAYGRALERVTIVCSRRHLEAVTRIVPLWWGIQVAENAQDTVQLREVRGVSDNPNIEPFAQAQLLWRDEALAALEARDLASGIRSKPRRVLWRSLAAELDPRELGEVVRETLRSRQGWRAETPQA
jgi:hypothetical protein